MMYCKWRWTYESLDDPVLVFAELDDERWNTRSVEIFKDGRKAYADERNECGTFLGKEPYPSDEEMEELNEDGDIFIVEITKEEFEDAWEKRKEKYSW